MPDLRLEIRQAADAVAGIRRHGRCVRWRTACPCQDCGRAVPVGGVFVEVCAGGGAAAGEERASGIGMILSAEMARPETLEGCISEWLDVWGCDECWLGAKWWVDFWH